MNPIYNPFTPGAGTKPPELAGRDEIINEASINIKRASLGYSCRSQMLLGLRGVGKTVLLNKLEDIAKQHQHITSFIEADENISLIQCLRIEVQQVLKKLSNIESLKQNVERGFAVLKSFLSNFNLTYADFSIQIEAEKGTADSGRLESDLTQLFLVIGELAQKAEKPWTLLIDEIQYLKQEDLAALIVALHKCNQKALPILLFGAGLPQLATMSAEAKSYAERLFTYPQIGALSAKDAKEAIAIPIQNLGESISETALDLVYEKTQGYPYFLQEWGAEIWKFAIEQQEIREQDVISASVSVFQNLDKGFFNVRFERLTPAEQEYVIAMASLGNGPYKTAQIAHKMQKTAQALSLVRSTTINKGMIYSPAHSELDFTVPLFADYLRRKFPKHPFIQQ